MEKEGKHEWSLFYDEQSTKLNRFVNAIEIGKTPNESGKKVEKKTKEQQRFKQMKLKQNINK